MKNRDVVETHFGSAAFRSSFSCLGEQLVTLLEEIEPLRPGLKWFVADVDAYGPIPFPRRDPSPVLVGDANALIQSARHVEQFSSGVFVGVPPAIERPTFRDGGLWTEDEEAADLGDAAIELRAFDTTYWSVASAEAGLIDSLRDRLRARVCNQ